MQSVPNLNICVSFLTLLSLLASVSWQPCLPFSFPYPGGLPVEGPYHAGPLVFWGALLCGVRGSSPGWQAAALQAAVAVSRVRVPLQPASANLSAQQAFSVLIQKACKKCSVCSIPHGFNGPESDLGCFHQKQPAEMLALWHA